MDHVGCVPCVCILELVVSHLGFVFTQMMARLAASNPGLVKHASRTEITTMFDISTDAFRSDAEIDLACREALVHKYGFQDSMLSPPDYTNRQLAEYGSADAMFCVGLHFQLQVS